MIIDIIIAIIALLAIVTGWRKGFITQLLQLVGLYIAILAAPDAHREIGLKVESAEGDTCRIIIFCCAFVISNFK